ncbi:MAG: GTP-binding protein [Candidatus Lokiarchaeota archaeon]|nr:GTP-binding protein [Candidatus Lokiarchaeota archaeon]
MENLLVTLLKNYAQEVDGILGVTVCDRGGLVITSYNAGDDELLLGAISTYIDSYIQRIRKEFNVESNFFNITTTENKKFAFCSMGSHSILTTIAEPNTSDVELRVLSEHVATKIELLLSENEQVSLEIPEIVKVLSKTRAGKLPNGDFSSKLILTGDFKVGKTSLIQRFVTNRFQENYMSTLGVEISKKILDLTPDTKFRFLIWDIGGQKMLAKPGFYNGANAAFIVIDRTRPDTLESVPRWYNEIKKTVTDDIPVVIVANKSDLTSKIVLSEEEIKDEARKIGFHYILTSAKTGENVPEVFTYIAYKILETM